MLMGKRITKRFLIPTDTYNILVAQFTHSGEIFIFLSFLRLTIKVVLELFFHSERNVSLNFCIDIKIFLSCLLTRSTERKDPFLNRDLLQFYLEKKNCLMETKGGFPLVVLTYQRVYLISSIKLTKNSNYLRIFKSYSWTFSRGGGVFTFIFYEFSLTISRSIIHRVNDSIPLLVFYTIVGREFFGKTEFWNLVLNFHNYNEPFIYNLLIF